MLAHVDPAAVLAAQKMLRAQLLDRRNAVTWRPARDLAAQLLLRLDEAASCWQFSVEWIRTAFDVERVDGGYADPAAQFYRMGSAEARREDIDVPSLQGISIDNRHPGMARLWSSPEPLVFTEIAQEKSLHEQLRQHLAEVRTYSKMAVALHAGGQPFGLLCIDHVERKSRWTGLQYERFRTLSAEVLMPVLSAAARMGSVCAGDESPRYEAGLQLLTRAELAIARLAATGMSYKEIARIQNRSLSTVDHQLRSIRRKLGVSSSGRLVHALRTACEAD